MSAIEPDLDTICKSTAVLLYWYLYETHLDDDSNPVPVGGFAGSDARTSL